MSERLTAKKQAVIRAAREWRQYYINNPGSCIKVDQKLWGIIDALIAEEQKAGEIKKMGRKAFRAAGVPESMVDVFHKVDELVDAVNELRRK